MALFEEPLRHSRMLSLTPLIDVVFLLLIFFMLVSTFSDTQVLRFATPSGERVSEQTDFELVPVRIGANGTIEIDDKPIAPELLALEMQKVADAAQEVTLVLVVEPKARTQLLINAIEAARSAGLKNIAMKKLADAEGLFTRKGGGQ